MCLPVKFLKCFIDSMASICIIMGLTSIISGMVLAIQNSKSSYKTLFTSSGAFAQDALVISMCIFGAFLVLIGIIGYCGSKRKNKYCFLIFDIGVLLEFIVFLVIATIAIYFTVEYDQQNTISQCINQNWSNEFYQLDIIANKEFCHIDCPCYIEESKFPMGYIAQFNFTITNSSSDPTQYSQCASYDNSSSIDKTYNLYTAAQNIFHCSGWCGINPIYEFSNVNNGVPKATKSCYFETIDFFHSQGQTIAIITFIISLICLLTIIATFCLCFHPSDKKEGNFYQRMIYYDQ